jgi:hypothetical protein
LLTQEHIETAQGTLDAAHQELTAGDVLQGSEKLWGAASHAIVAAAKQRGWQFGNHRAMINAARRIADEQDDDGLRAGLAAAQHFHANFYHGFIEDEDIEPNAELVRRFVSRMLALAR